MQTLQKFEIVISGLIALICIIFIWESWDLPPGTFEPLGSGPVPQVSATIIIVCCIAVIYGAFKKVAVNVDTDSVPIAVGAGVLMALATLLFVIALHFRIMPFAWMTTLFLTVTIWGLEKFNKKKLLPAIITGLIVGFAIQYLFTQVFVVDLPA